MKAKLFFSILLTVVALLLVGCSTSDETTTIDSTSANVSESSTVPDSSSEEVTEMFIFDGEYSPILPKAEMPTQLYTLHRPENQYDLLTAVSLQGIMARKGTERLFVQYDTSTTAFVKTIKDQYPDCKVTNITSLWNFLEKDISRVSGYILTDLHDDSINVATSIAGFLNAVIITPYNKTKAEDLGLTCLLDARDKDDAWLRGSEYWSQLNPKIAFMHKPDNFENLRDYAIFCGAYTFTDQLSTQEAITEKVKHLKDGFLILGWNTACGELDTVRALAKQNGSIIAADYAKNLATLSSFKLYSAEQKTEVEEESSSKHHTVTIVISDGDNLQWALNTLPTSPNWFKNPARGKFALGWGLPPTLIDVAPPVLEHYYQTMKTNEEFIMQLSGIGYTFPSLWTNKIALLNMQMLLAEQMKRADMSVMEILDDVRLSQEFVESYYGGFLKQDAIDGILYIDYSDYSCYNGQVFWVNGKPVVTARHRIWADFTDINTLAKNINAASTNPKSVAAYSFIIVHAWSGLDANGKVVANGNTLDAVKELVDKLDKDVDVVTPSEFIRRITENTPHD